MTKRRDAKKESSSPQKIWLIGIAGTLLIGSVTFIGSGIYSKWKNSPLSDREQTSVIKLIDDIRNSPIFFHAVYQGKHKFITSQWRKSNAYDSYYESAETQATIFRLGYAMSRFGDGLKLFDEKSGIGSGVIKNFDQFAEPPGGIILGSQIITAPERHTPAIDFNAHDIPIYTMQPTAFPVSILSHAKNLDLPSSIRWHLAAMESLGSPMNFQKVLKITTDFVLVSQGSMARDDLHDSKIVVYFHGPNLTLFEYAGQCLQLAESIQEWADQNSIDLGDDSIGAYEKVYRVQDRQK